MEIEIGCLYCVRIEVKRGAISKERLRIWEKSEEFIKKLDFKLRREQIIFVLLNRSKVFFRSIR